MTLKNEIFEGIAAYKGLTPTSQDRYYDYLLENAQAKKKKDEAVEAGGPAEIDRINKQRAGQVGTTAVPTIASTATPGTVPGSTFNPTMPVTATNMPQNDNPNYQAARGGMIPRRAINTGYRAGGAVTPHGPDDDEDEMLEPPRGGDDDDDDAPRKMPSIEYHGYGTDYGTPRHPHPYKPYYGPRKEEPAWIQRNDDSAFGYDDENIPDDGERYSHQARYRRGGAIDTMSSRFQAGGNVGDPTDPGGEVDPRNWDPPPIDKLVMQLLQREGGSAADKINRSVGEPWTVTGAGSEWGKEGADYRAAELAKTRAAQQRDAQAMVTSAPPVEPSTRAGRVLRDVSDFVNPVGSGGEYQRRQQDLAGIRDAEAAIPGLFSTSTEPEIAQAREQAAKLRRELAERSTSPIDVPSPGSVADVIPSMVRHAAGERTPVGAGGGLGGSKDEPQSQPPPDTEQRVPSTPSTPPDPRAGPISEADRRARAGDPDYINIQPESPTKYPTKVPPPARPTGPTGTATAQAPPPGAGSTNAPTTARKGLRDPTRQEAFDPALDLQDPYNAHKVDQNYQPVQYTQQDIHQVVNAGLSVGAPNGQQPTTGTGAVSRPVFNAWVSAHDQGGRLTPGQALMVGMIGKYKVLLSQGRATEAAHMAWGIMQAANLEAASWGHVALDQLRANNLPGAVSTIAKAADLSPDGMHHRVSADGMSIETYDSTGKITAKTPVDGRMALAAAYGLADGTLLWTALQTAAATTQKPDRNAEGRQLTNDLRREQIEGARLRNRRLRTGGTSGGLSQADREMASLFGQTNALNTGGTERAQGDEMPIDYNPEPTEPTES